MERIYYPPKPPCQGKISSSTIFSLFFTFAISMWLCTPSPRNCFPFRNLLMFAPTRLLDLVRLVLGQRARRDDPAPPTMAEWERRAECLRGLQREYEGLVKKYEGRLDDVEQVEGEV